MVCRSKSKQVAPASFSVSTKGTNRLLVFPFFRGLSRKKNHYRNVRDNLLFHLSSSPMAERFTISGKDSGLHFLLKIQTNQQEEQLKKKLEAAGIQVAFLSQYHHFSEGNQDDATNTLVINYSALKKEQIPQLVSRLSQAL